MIKLIKEETVTDIITTQIIYKEALIDLDYISDSKRKKNRNSLFISNSVSGIKPVYYNKYNRIEGGVSELSVRIITEGLVAKNDWYIDNSGSATFYDPIKNFLTRLNGNNGPFIDRFKAVGINEKGKDGLPFITEEQISKIVNIMNSPESNKELPILAIPMRLIAINGNLSSETIIANEDGSFPFLTMKEYIIAKESAESTEEN